MCMYFLYNAVLMLSVFAFKMTRENQQVTKENYGFVSGVSVDCDYVR